jgi:hypothetical protein
MDKSFDTKLNGMTDGNQVIKQIKSDRENNIWVSVKDKGLVGDGIVNDTTALNTLITSIGSLPTDLYFFRGTYKLGSNITIPSNINIILANGAILKRTNSAIITLNCSIDADLSKHFDDDGTGSWSGIPKIREVYPEWFGAVGDGIVDDSLAIYKCHDFANRSNLKVIYQKGTYKLNTVRNILIKTNTDFGRATFLIDESISSETVPWFTVNSDYEPVEVDSSLWGAIRTKLVSGISIISELSPYKNSLVVITDNDDKIGARYGYTNDWARQDFFYIDEGGKVVGDSMYGFSNITSMISYPCDLNYLTIEGGTFLVNGQDSGHSGDYVRPVFQVNRSRTIIRNQFIGIINGASDVQTDPLIGFYNHTYTYDTIIENVRMLPRKGTTGTYGIRGRTLLKHTLKNITSEGDSTYWGVTSFNLIKDWKIEDCNLNRVDSHFIAWNVTIRDTNVGIKGILLTGGGTLRIENTKCNALTNIFVEFRQDYGSRWNGDIIITNSKLLVYNQNIEARIIDFNPADFDYKYDIIFANKILVNTFTFDFSNSGNNAGAWMMKIPNFSSGSNVGRIRFPNDLQFINVKVQGRTKGLKFLQIFDPLDYTLTQTGSYNVNDIKPNCYMKFEDIQSEEINNGLITSTNNVHFIINTTAVSTYTDENSLYPKVDIINCRGGGLLIHPKGGIVDLTIKDSIISLMDAFETDKGRSRITFLNCGFRANIASAGQYLYLDTVLGTTFINSTFHAPIINGVVDASQTAVDNYNVIKLNSIVRYNHINTKLEKLITDTTPVSSAYIQKLQSHHKSENINVLYNSVTFNPASLNDGDSEITTITVTGAELGYMAIASFNKDLQGILLTAYVSATDTVSVRFINQTGGVVNLAEGTLKVRVIES